MLVSGLIDIELRWKGGLERLQLDPLNRALLIEPPVWSRQIYRGDHSSMVVFCDTAYDPSDYIFARGLACLYLSSSGFPFRRGGRFQHGAYEGEPPHCRSSRRNHGRKSRAASRKAAICRLSFRS